MPVNQLHPIQSDYSIRSFCVYGLLLTSCGRTLCYKTMWIQIQGGLSVWSKCCSLSLTWATSYHQEGFLFWTCWAEVLFFCSSRWLDIGGGGRAGGGKSSGGGSPSEINRKQASTTVHLRDSPAYGEAGRNAWSATQTFCIWNYSVVTRNINFQLFVFPVHFSTTWYQRVTEGKSPLVLINYRPQTPLISLLIDFTLLRLLSTNNNFPASENITY